MVIDTISFEVYQKTFPKRLPNPFTRMFDLRKFYFSLLMEFTLRSMTRTLSLGLVGGLGAHATINNQPEIEQTYAPAQTINQLTAKNIALDVSHGGLVTKTHMIEDNNMKQYEISIINQNKKFNVNIDATTGNVLKID
jgi:predicted small secreted protein